MKKIYCMLILLSVEYSMQAMLLIKPLRHSHVISNRRGINRHQLQVLQKRTFSTYSDNNVSQSTFNVSEECYQACQNIVEDFVRLKYYMQGVCNGIAETGRTDVNPSAVLKWARDISDIDTRTKLKYMPATNYICSFITDKNYVDFDKAFSQKYAETGDLQKTWDWFHGHFMQHMKTAFENYSQDMIERDAAKITLAEQGIHFDHSGRTIFFDGYRISEDPKDMEKVGMALRRIYKKE